MQGRWHHTLACSPTPGLRAGGPQAPTWHRGGRSICPPARSDLEEDPEQGNAPSLKGFEGPQGSHQCRLSVV